MWYKLKETLSLESTTMFLGNLALSPKLALVGTTLYLGKLRAKSKSTTLYIVACTTLCSRYYKVVENALRKPLSIASSIWKRLEAIWKRVFSTFKKNRKIFYVEKQALNFRASKNEGLEAFGRDLEGFRLSLYKTSVCIGYAKFSKPPFRRKRSKRAFPKNA